MPHPYPKKLLSSNTDYELWTAENSKLQYVVLKSEGQKKIAEHYKDRYKIEISVVEHDSLDQKLEEECLYHEINRIAASLDNWQAKGLVFTSRVPSQSYTSCHAEPYIIAKEDNQIIVVNFKMRGNNVLKKWMKGQGREREFWFENVDNYDNETDSQKHVKLQKDRLLCGTFAVDVLKQCLCDQEFKKKVLTFTPEISLTKLKLGQSSEYIAQLSEEQKAKYVRDISGEKNLDSWYKAHCYARRLNPQHIDLVDEVSRDLIEDIDRVRAQYREKKEIEIRDSEKLKQAQLTGTDLV